MKKRTNKRKAFITLITIAVVVLTSIVPPGFSIRAKAANSKRERAAAIAYGEVGNTDRTKYGAGADEEWCAYFATWCARQAGLDNSKWIYTGSTNILVAFFESKGRWHNKTTRTWDYTKGGWRSIGTGIIDNYMPQKGDFVAIENYTGDPEPGHTGIVYDVNPSTGKLYTIEGNTGSPRAVRMREYSLSSLYRTDGSGLFIVGFGEPDYGPDDDLKPTGYTYGVSKTEVYDTDYFTLTCKPYESDITNITLVINGSSEMDVTDLMKNGNGSSDFTLFGNNDGTYEFGFRITNPYGSFTGTRDNNGVVNVTKKSISWGSAANLGEQFTGWIINNYSGRVAIQSTDVVCKKASGAKNEYWTFFRQSDGSYLIRSLNNNKYLALKSQSKVSGVEITTSSTADNYAKWFIYKSNDDYIFRNAAYNAGVLDLHNGGSSDGDPFHMMTYSNHVAQKFSILKRIPLGYVTLDKSLVNLKAGETTKVIRNLNPSNTNDVYSSYSWKSSNEKVVTVSGTLEEANIKAVGEGTATITYTVNTKLGQTCSETLKVTVQKNTVDVTGISLSAKNLNLKSGDKQKLSATIIPSNATDKGIIWSSDKTYVAEVDKDGNVEAKGEGTAIITATSKANPNIKATCTVEVYYPPIQGPLILLFNNGENKVKVGQEIQYSCFINAEDLPSKNIVWSSSDESIFTVTQSGVVTGKKAGEAVLKVAFAADTSVYDSIVIRVEGKADDDGGSSSDGSDEGDKPGTGGNIDSSDEPGIGGDSGNESATGGNSSSESRTGGSNGNEKSKEDISGNTEGESQNQNVNNNTERENYSSSNQQASVDSSNTEYLEKGKKVSYKNAKYVVTDIGKVAYAGITGKKKTSVTIPDSITVAGNKYQVTAIADNAFKNNAKIKKIKIGTNISVIGKGAFSGCKNLKSVIIPQKVENIGAKAFYKCKSLKSVQIKSKIISRIGKMAFSKISKNAKIAVPKSKRKDYKKFLKKAGFVLK